MSHIKIEPIGTVLRTDEHGHFISLSSVDRMVEPWKSAAHAAVEVAKQVLGDNLHSAYVRGSASRGEAVLYISDLDIFLVVHKSLSDEQRKKLHQAKLQLEKEFSFATKVELPVLYVDRVLGCQDPNWIYIKIYSVCLYGKDVSARLPEVSPDRSVIMFAPDCLAEINDRLTRIKQGELSFSKNACTWMMKRLLRSGFELVMEREQAFTRDLFPCYKLFSKYYPEKEPQMRRVLEYALNPTDTMNEITDLVGPFARWLDGEAKRVLGGRPNDPLPHTE